MAPFLTYTHFLWFIFIEPKRKILDWAVILFYGLIVVALRAPDYLAAISYGLLSHRHAAQIFADNSLTKIALDSIPRLHAVLRFMAQFYLLLALVVCWKTIDRFGRIVAALVAGVAISSVAIVVKPYATSILPLLGSFSIARLLEFHWLFVAIGAGSFVFHLEKGAKKAAEQNAAPFRRVKMYAPALAILVIFAGSLDPKFKMVTDWISQGSYVHAFESPVLKNLAQKINRETIPVRVSTFQMYPNLLHPYGIETVGGYQALHLKRFNEYWSAVTEPSPSNITGDRLMLNPADHKPEWDLSAEFNVNLLSLANMKYIVSRDRLKAPNLKPVREIARPWHGLTTIEKIKTNFVENFTGRTSLFVYENTDVFPRIFFAESVRSFESATAVLNALKTANINELEQTVFLEKQHLPRVLAEKPLLGQGKIILRQYSPDKLDLDVEIADDALMVVTNGYSPYWSAEIDGQPADIFPVYHTFWGIHLPKSAKKLLSNTKFRGTGKLTFSSEEPAGGASLTP